MYVNSERKRARVGEDGRRNGSSGQSAKNPSLSTERSKIDSVRIRVDKNFRELTLAIY